MASHARDDGVGAPHTWGARVVPGESEGVEGEGEFAGREHVEERGVRRAKGGDVVGTRRVDFKPFSGAWVKGEGGGHVWGTGALDVHGEPGLGGVDVAEGGGDRTLPFMRHVGS